ncbi:MAG: CDP-alcohol phosphatidyltransferase family protein [Chlamydiia bacterium]|nr:CDP-alcohol phosphatidyltransferase family protein [Chlamydiia bacterium]
MNQKIDHKMFNLSNSLSLVRAPLALAFLSSSASIRVIAIVLAMITDSIDGYIARRYKFASRFGAILDPAMDKFFVYFALAILFSESKLETWQIFAIVSRDFFLMLFAIYLLSVGALKNYEYRSIRWGKASTALQFIVLIGICLQVFLPSSVYIIFIVMGSLAFIELFIRLKVSQE